MVRSVRCRVMQEMVQEQGRLSCVLDDSMVCCDHLIVVVMLL